MFKDLGS